MNIGMLWFDNDPKTTLAEKIKTAAEYYKNKYGHYPNTCMAHPSALAGQKYDPEHVKPLKSILPGHFWLGMEETKAEVVHEYA
jgi:hypothetical protein